MKSPLCMNHSQHVEVFESIVDMVRGFATLAANGDSASLDALDRRMNAGSVVRVTISVGSAGPLGVLLQGVDQDGSIFDILTMDAPPAVVPFRLRVPS